MLTIKIVGNTVVYNKYNYFRLIENKNVVCRVDIIKYTQTN